MARPIDWTALEKSSSLLAALPEPARRTARVLDFARTARLFSRSDRPKAMYFVVSGGVHLVRSTCAGTEIVLQRVHGGFVAEASLDQTAYHCDAVAIASSEILILPRKPFHDALSDVHFRDRWIAHLARELRRVRGLAERLNLKTAQQRIIHYIETEGDERGVLQLSRSKKEWAAELGLTHEALYRTLASMVRAEKLTIDGASIALTRTTVHRPRR